MAGQLVRSTLRNGELGGALLLGPAILLGSLQTQKQSEEHHNQLEVERSLTTDPEKVPKITSSRGHSDLFHPVSYFVSLLCVLWVITDITGHTLTTTAEE